MVIFFVLQKMIVDMLVFLALLKGLMPVFLLIPHENFWQGKCSEYSSQRLQNGASKLTFCWHTLKLGLLKANINAVSELAPLHLPHTHLLTNSATCGGMWKLFNSAAATKGNLGWGWRAMYHVNSPTAWETLVQCWQERNTDMELMHSWLTSEITHLSIDRICLRLTC